MRAIPCLLCLGFLCVVASAQPPVMVVQDVSAAGFRAGSPGVFWAKALVQNWNYRWPNVAVAGVFTTRQLVTPVTLPNLGQVHVDLSTIFHADLAMSTRHIRTDPVNPPFHFVIFWTRTPSLPPSTVGMQVYCQFLLYDRTSPVVPMALTGLVKNRPHGPLCVVP